MIGKVRTASAPTPTAAGRTSAPPRSAPWRVVRAIVAACLVALAFAGAPQGARAAAAAEPAVSLSLQEAAKGTALTVTGTGWPAGTMVMLLLCGQNMIGGTNSCANADGVAVSVDAGGAFAAQLPVVAPPKPCPCVVDVTSVNGDQSTVATPFKITDHEVAELPAESGTARLALLTGVELQGDDGVLTWFGAPPSRKFVVTVGNLGSAPVKDPVFQLGTAHGVFAPLWEEAPWKGTIQPGQKARVELDVALTAGAYGDYTVSLKYGEKVLAAQPWGVDRPYGVLLFWVLLGIVVPAALFRTGMAVVDKVRPRTAPAAGQEGTAPSPPGAPQTTTAVLPWFTPDSAPGSAQPSAPAQDHPTTKGHS
ncbi:neocarzinostatin apoprotein domain-containing protein [Streptomyces sp. NPDC090022]|uniref:neocarzinostatin apoprotein domain-containing protein n=1 Tax=Streptomyces sp. NPDC090022 TaxID=3365920 RepID=UPI0038048D12